ncbi:hypothetical protein [Streptomyces scabiei]|uniref:hypothetical protein n=1 Tax=Streptomyces scabiei TaxID=1930 RepID=UPI0029BEA1F8|nr:hypothetical protein [Streptomyces scabiei]MDX3028096.1 hypothetical protein [Streptomyces scabiei]
MKPGNQKLLLALEVAFVVLAMTGVGMVYLPAALFLGGALGVVATERAMARQTPAQRRPKEVER